MDVVAAKQIGAGLATIAFVGSGIGIRLIDAARQIVDVVGAGRLLSPARSAGATSGHPLSGHESEHD